MIKTIFIGTSEFAKTILEDISDNEELEIVAVITVEDKPSGRKQELIPSPVKIFSMANGFQLIQPGKIIEAKEKIKELNPDIILLTDYGQKIPQEILDIPKNGSLNIHPSLLPNYQGATPIQSVILNGEKETGVSIILMSEKIDEGPIIAQEKVEIEERVRYADLEQKLAIRGAEMFNKIIKDWVEGKVEVREQSKENASKTKIIKKEDGKIDWTNSAELIERKVRAFNPWPSTYSFLDGKVVKIWEAEVQEQTSCGPFGELGKMYLGTNETIAVQAGKNFLIIKELQLEGKKRVKTNDFLKGNMNIIGKILK